MRASHSAPLYHPLVPIINQCVCCVENHSMNLYLRWLYVWYRLSVLWSGYRVVMVSIAVVFNGSVVCVSSGVVVVYVIVFFGVIIR